MRYLFAKIALVLPTTTIATPFVLEERQHSCPDVHVFGARETTAPVGYGTAGIFVNLILNAYPVSDAEIINHPAEGSTNSAYSASVRAGTQATASQINSYNAKCPNTKLVVVGYSQGAQIVDNALCGGGDLGQGITNTSPLLTSAASTAVKAVIWAGNPRYAPGQPFNYGTCLANGFDPRPAAYSCSPYTSRIRSYCDSPDPACCDGNNTATHQGYGSEYGQNALAFVKSKLG